MCFSFIIFSFLFIIIINYFIYYFVYYYYYCFSFIIIIYCCEGAQVCTRVCTEARRQSQESSSGTFSTSLKVFFIALNFSERHSPISASPELGLQPASLCIFPWVLGIKCIYLYLQGKQSINWAISPVSEVCVFIGKTFYEKHRKSTYAPRWFFTTGRKEVAQGKRCSKRRWQRGWSWKDSTGFLGLWCFS